MTALFGVDAGVNEANRQALSAAALAAVGNTIDVARHLVAQHSYGEIAQIVVSEAVMIVAGLDTRVASMRDIVLPSSERLQVIPIDGAAALFGNPEQTSLS